MIIWAEFTAEINGIARRMESMGRKVWTFDGHSKNNGQRCAQFENGEADIDTLICHPASVGHGVTLTRAKHAIWYSHCFSYELHHQARCRNYRKGQDEKVFRYYLIAEDTGDDFELISKASTASNGDKFAALWQGNLSNYANDHSRADQALCMMLAFWTGGDEPRIDSLFRRSGLYRPKWDEKRGELTYGQITINQALKNCKEFYEPDAYETDEEFGTVLDRIYSKVENVTKPKQKSRPFITNYVLKKSTKKEDAEPKYFYCPPNIMLAQLTEGTNGCTRARSAFRQVAPRTPCREQRESVMLSLVLQLNDCRKFELGCYPKPCQRFVAGSRPPEGNAVN